MQIHTHAHVHTLCFPQENAIAAVQERQQTGGNKLARRFTPASPQGTAHRKRPCSQQTTQAQTPGGRHNQWPMRIVPRAWTDSPAVLQYCPQAAHICRGLHYTQQRTLPGHLEQPAAPLNLAQPHAGHHSISCQAPACEEQRGSVLAHAGLKPWHPGRSTWHTGDILHTHQGVPTP